MVLVYDFRNLNSPSVSKCMLFWLVLINRGSYVSRLDPMSRCAAKSMHLEKPKWPTFWNVYGYLL
jgi:hypothetical protein